MESRRSLSSAQEWLGASFAQKITRCWKSNRNRDGDASLIKSTEAGVSIKFEAGAAEGAAGFNRDHTVGSDCPCLII